MNFLCNVCRQPLMNGDEFFTDGKDYWHRTCGPIAPQDRAIDAMYWMNRAREAADRTVEAENLLKQWAEANRPNSIADTEPEWAEGFDFLWGQTVTYFETHTMQPHR